MRMNRTMVGLGMVLWLGLSLLVVAEQEEVQGYETFTMELPSEVHEAVENHFLRPRTPSPELISTNANIDVQFAKTLSLSFVYESANFRSSVGYFTYDEDGTVLDEQIVFDNFSGTGPGLLGGGTLNPGDTVTLGSFAPGERVGFFLIANGFTNPNGHRWYTLPELNRDGKDHDAAIVLENIGTLIGFEDLWNLGDRDYNDAMMLVTTVLDAIEPEGGNGRTREPRVDPFMVAITQTAHLLGIDGQEAAGIVGTYGLHSVSNALRTASDMDSFWAAMIGYDLLAGGGGGGSSDSEDASHLLEFSLSHPVTGDLIESEHVIVTIAQSVVTPEGLNYNILEVIAVSFNAETESYRYDFQSLSLDAGWYELCLQFSNGTSQIFGMFIPAAE